MKKFYSFAIVMMAGVLAMTSCSNDDEMLNESARVINPNEIAFDTGQKGISSKSGTTVTSLSDFYVRASTSDDDVYFDAEHFSYDGTAFRSETDHYWPTTGTLNFYASNQQEALTAGTQANPSPIVDDYECDGIKDWVTATVKAGEKTIPYPLTFQHVLSQIKITAEAKDKTQDLVYKVVGVKLSAPDTGDYQFANATAGVGTWTIDNSSSGDYTYEQNMNGTFNPTAATEADQTWASTDYFNILPVTSGTLTFDVQYQVIQNGQVIGDFTGANSKQVTVDAPNLLSGKIYTYNFVLAINTNDVITFTVNTTAWGSGSTTDVQVPELILANLTLTDETLVKIKSTGTLTKDMVSAYKNNLKTIEITNNCTSLQTRAFYDFETLVSVNLPTTIKSIPECLFAQCVKLTSITIPNSVTSIGLQAFSGCSRLTSVTIPNSVTSIAGSAFYGCSSLTSVTLPNSITSISNSLFEYSGLRSITIPSTIRSIGDFAFRYSSNLRSVTIPNSVTNIGFRVFQACPQLTAITYTGTISEWNSISKNSNWNTLSSITVIHCTDGDIEI